MVEEMGLPDILAEDASCPVVHAPVDEDGDEDDDEDEDVVIHQNMRVFGDAAYAYLKFPEQIDRLPKEGDKRNREGPNPSLRGLAAVRTTVEWAFMMKDVFRIFRTKKYWVLKQHFVGQRFTVAVLLRNAQVLVRGCHTALFSVRS